jgi:hypothetical protein
VPDKCDLGRQRECVDYVVKSGATGNVSLYVKNNFGKTIKVTKVAIRRDSGTGGVVADYGAAGVVILPGAAGQLVVTSNIVSLDLQPKEKTGLVVNVTFQRNDPVGSPHTLIGILYATAK